MFEASLCSSELLLSGGLWSQAAGGDKWAMGDADNGNVTVNVVILCQKLHWAILCQKQHSHFRLYH